MVRRFFYDGTIMLNALIFLLNTFATIACATLFVRAWIYWRRIPPFNPYSSFIYRISDFIIVPVRKVIPSSTYIDFPSLFAALIICFIQVFATAKLMVWGVTAYQGIPLDIDVLALESIRVFIHNFLSIVLWLGLLYAILSWVSPLSPFQSFLRALMEPLLNPIRNMLPAGLRNAPIDVSLFLLVIIIITLQLIIRDLFN